MVVYNSIVTRTLGATGPLVLAPVEGVAQWASRWN